MDKEKSHTAGDSDRQGTEHPPPKCIRCGSLDNIITNTRKCLKIMKKDERPSVSMEGTIVHFRKNPRNVMIITIKIYMHLWHVYLVMDKVLLEIFVTVINRPI